MLAFQSSITASSISWVDAIKLAIPVLTAFTVIGVRVWYEGRRTRRAFEQAMITGFRAEPFGLQESVEDILSAPQHVAAGKPFHRYLLVPQPLLDCAKRLSELNPRHAGVYVALAGNAQALEQAVKTLNSLLEKYHTSADPTHPRLQVAIADVAAVVATVLVEFERSKLDMMKHLGKHGMARPTASEIETIEASILGASARVAKGVAAPALAAVPAPAPDPLATIQAKTSADELPA